ncbi:MAG TPA: threonine/serine dehydratase [Allosphingosinicella sp.]|nr:threonine/serine dehydratase [Allosphingosinicella sp.]
MIKRTASPEGVSAAAKRIRCEVVRTPLLPFEWEGRRIWAKAECLQTGGSFKLRGAVNRLMQLGEAEKARGVVAFSSGNHAQGVAIAARRLGIQATIVMPSDAPRVKRDSTAAAGARIVECDRHRESREEIAARIAAETGAVVVPSFDDVDIIEGQGTAGVEIGGQMIEACGALPDEVLVPCGGGGLSAGISLALPEARIVAVEPQGWDDMGRSLAAGRRVPVEEPAPPTRCDALQTKLVSPLTLEALRSSNASATSVGEEEVERAMAFAMRQLRLVVEPGGAVALAALLTGKAASSSERTVVVLSGGNVDPLLYSEIVGRQAAAG